MADDRGRHAGSRSFRGQCPRVLWNLFQNEGCNEGNERLLKP